MTSLWRYDAAGRTMRALSNAPLEFEDGATYRLDVVEERSLASHRHYFARVAELWSNLPERLSEEPWALTPDFLRHYALIREGYCHCAAYPCASAAEARRWIERLPRPRGERGEPVFFIRKIEGSTLYEWTPETQKMLGNGGMGRDRFQRSKDAVLGFIEALVGVSSEDAA